MTRFDHPCVVAVVAVALLGVGGLREFGRDVQDPGTAEDQSGPEDEIREIIEAKIAAARELVTLREDAVARVRAWVESSAMSPAELNEQKRGLFDARLLELGYRQELLVTGSREPETQERAREIREIVEEKIAVARELLALEQAALDKVVLAVESGRLTSLDVSEAKERIVEARLSVLAFRQELLRLKPVR